MKPRYILDKNVLKTNPASRKEKKEHSSLLHPNASLAIISSEYQAAQARQVMGDALAINDLMIAQMAKVPKELLTLFEAKEIPLGLLETLSTLKKMPFRFYVLDLNQKNIKKAEQRLHEFVDILKYTNFDSIKIEVLFFSFPGGFELIQKKDESAEEFANKAHSMIVNEFAEFKKSYDERKKTDAKIPRYTIFRCLDHALREDQRNFTYLLTDDLSKDDSLADAEELLKNRKVLDPMSLTMISLTHNEETNKWLREVSRKSANTVFIEGFHAERKRVAHCQGSAFPYSKGMWLLAQLFSIDVEGFALLTKAYPLPGEFLNVLLGRKISKLEYEYYFNLHPKADRYRNLLEAFFTNNERKSGKEIIEAHKCKDVLFKAAKKEKGDTKAEIALTEVQPKI